MFFSIRSDPRQIREGTPIKAHASDSSKRDNAAVARDTAQSSELDADYRCSYLHV